MKDNNHVRINFLGNEINIIPSTDISMCLWMIEIMEIKFSEGEHWLNVLKNKYNTDFADKELENHIKTILKNRGESRKNPDDIVNT